MTLGIIVAIVTASLGAAGLAFNIYDKHRSRLKKLRSTIVTDSHLIRTMALRLQAPQLTVQWGNVVVDEPRVIVVQVTNVGRVELRVSDLSLPPTLHVMDAKIISADVARRPHKSQTLQELSGVTVTEHTVVAPKVMLNHGDALLFEVCVDGGTQDPSLDIHAAGFTMENGKG